VLPDVDADDGNMAEERVLVGGGSDLEMLGGRIQSEPSPARSLDSSGRVVHLLLHVIEVAEGGNDGLLERTVLQDASIALLLGCRGRKVLPEERVVDMASAVKLKGSLECDALLRGGGLGVRRLSGVECVDVGLMVLLVVKLHDLPRDKGLKGIVGVGEVR